MAHKYVFYMMHIVEIFCTVKQNFFVNREFLWSNYEIIITIIIIIIITFIITIIRRRIYSLFDCIRQRLMYDCKNCKDRRYFITCLIAKTFLRLKILFYGRLLRWEWGYDVNSNGENFLHSHVYLLL